MTAASAKVTEISTQSDTDTLLSSLYFVSVRFLTESDIHFEKVSRSQCNNYSPFIA